MDEIAARHPEFADQLKEPPWDENFKDSPNRQGRGLNTERQENLSQEGSSSSNQIPPEINEPQQNLTNFGLRNTVPLGPGVLLKEERQQRSMSAPPDHRANEKPQRFVTKCEIPIMHDPSQDPANQKSGRNTPDNAQHKSNNSPNVRVIPIQVEGRDAPLLNTNIDTATNFGAESFREPSFDGRLPRDFGAYQRHSPRFGHKERTPTPPNQQYAHHYQQYVPPQQHFSPSQQYYGPSQQQFGPSQQHFGPSQQHFGPSQQQHFGPSQQHFGSSQFMPQQQFVPQQQQQQQQQHPQQNYRYQDNMYANQHPHGQKPQTPPHQKQPSQPQFPQQSQPQPTAKPDETDSKPAPQPKPEPIKDPIERVQVIQKEVEELMKQVESFNGNSRADKQYLMLDELLTRQLLLLDNIDTEGKENVRQARKDTIKSIQRCISTLENKVPAGENEGDSSSVNSKEEKDEKNVAESGSVQSVTETDKTVKENTPTDNDNNKKENNQNVEVDVMKVVKESGQELKKEKKEE